ASAQTAMVEKLYDTAKLVGYNQFGDVVYSVRLPLHEYYDGEHSWDSGDGVLELRMTKLCGTLYDTTGNVTQEFESAFCADSGAYVGGRATFDDGTTQSDGTYADA
ncbi:hypothetical protein, partial [Rhodopirellula sallentina]